MSILIERDVSHGGGAHAIRIGNDAISLVVSTDYGPRILAYERRGGTNVFGFLEPAASAKPTPLGENWHIYGGHRLWHAPEDPVRSYVPDNAPIAVAIEEASDRTAATLKLTRPIEALTALEKEIRVTIASEGSHVAVEHRITNGGRSDVVLATWALSLMAPGGEAIVPNAPFVPFPEGLLPARRIVLWPYTSLSDPRFRFGPRFLRIRQDVALGAAQKLGLADTDHGWAAYALDDVVFVKRFVPARRDTPLTDLGCNVEVFVDGRFLELETLGAETTLAPGDTATHFEHWYLYDRAISPSDDDDQLARTFDAITELEKTV